jgi:hypothetical protein
MMGNRNVSVAGNNDIGMSNGCRRDGREDVGVKCRMSAGCWRVTTGERERVNAFLVRVTERTAAVVDSPEDVLSELLARINELEEFGFASDVPLPDDF